MYNRQSIPPQVPSQLKHQDSVFNKMNTSGKKTSNNKISIYSKRSTNNNSPNKKSTNNSINLPTKNQYKFLQGSSHLQSSEKYQSQPNNIQLRKISTFKQQRKVQLHKQHSQQLQNNHFYSHNSQNLKKQEPLSQLRARQTESQANQSSFDISFVIGGSSQFNLQSNSKPTVKPQIMMGNIMKLMQQQILLAKNAYYQKTNQTLKSNAKLIQQVNNKLIKNQQMLKKKDRQIIDLKNKLQNKEVGSPKKSTSSSKSNSINNQLPPTIPKNKKQQQLFLHKKITDLQKQIVMIAQNSENQALANKINNKVSLIQKGLLKYFSSKVNVLDQKLSTFVKLKQQKINHLQQALKKLENSMGKTSLKQIQKIQLKIKQILKQVDQLKNQQKIFKSKQFKYQNFKIVQFQRQVKELKSQLRQIEGMQFQNQKLFKILQAELNKSKQDKSNIVESFKPKFMNEGEKTVYRNVFLNSNNNIQYSRQNANITEDSIISMNFSQTQESLYSCQNKNLNMENAFSKLIKITDMKETNAPTQNSPFLNKQYFIPNKAPLLQKVQVQSRIQPYQKLTNPNAQNKIELLTPKKPPASTLIYHKDHSNSFWSISQLQDVVEPTPNNQQVNDFDDDQFYYPLQQSKSRLFASRLSKNNSNQFNSPNSQKKQNFSLGVNSQNNIFGIGSKKQSHLYHMNDQYQNFSEQEEEDYKQTVKQQKFNKYAQKLTTNQQNLMQLIKSQKCQTPLKVKLDKKGFMIIKSVNDKNQKLNGKQIKMQLQQAQNLSQMGLITILSVY